jgi:hypothetical protein
MKRLFLAVPAILLAAAVLAPAGEEGKQAEPKVAKRTVIIPEDTTPFEVQRNERVRLTGEGIAGSKIVAEVEGPARIAAESAIRVVKGGKTLIGVARVEFEIVPTGKGVVKVKITSTPPQPDSKPTVTHYQFEVK